MPNTVVLPPVTPETPPAPTPPPVIESGPVTYEEPAEEEEDEEVEEPCVSAMKLIGGNGQCEQLVIKNAVSQIYRLYVYGSLYLYKSVLVDC